LYCIVFVLFLYCQSFLVVSLLFALLRLTMAAVQSTSEQEVDRAQYTADGVRLLNDAEMQDYLRRGYLSFLPPSVSADQHDICYYGTLECLQREGNMGNNVYPMLRELLAPVLEDGRVRGTLRSLLGERYVMLPHRFCHWNQPSKTRAQRWHRDTYWGYKMRCVERVWRQVRVHLSFSFVCVVPAEPQRLMLRLLCVLASPLVATVRTSHSTPC
jgi:hypothetical protein